ncbi:MAG: DUF5682 family protein, partial [Pirellulaceae bacterium]
MSWQIHVFGVRHLSPMGAWQLRACLESIRPEVVLIEGLDDATPLIPDMARQATRPPIAILAYTDGLPIRTLVYPLARYSPEYQAIRWALDNQVRVEFIDLASEHFLGLLDLEVELAEKARARAARDADGEPSRSGPAPTVPLPASESQEAPTPQSAIPEPRQSLYERWAQLAGERDYETYWERNYEHNHA